MHLTCGPVGEDVSRPKRTSLRKKQRQVTVEAHQKVSPGHGGIVAVVRGISHADVSSSSMWGSSLRGHPACQHSHLLSTHDLLVFRSTPSNAG